MRHALAGSPVRTGERGEVKRSGPEARQPEEPTTSTRPDISKLAADVFGYRDLRPGQQDAVAALADGRDCLALMPSGAGKSAVYQLGTLALGGAAGGVSPLISLQRDQGEHLTRHGLTAATVNGSTSESQRAAAYDLLRAGKTAVGFLAPAQLAREDVRGILAEAPPRLLAVDEAHCVSAWGHDFRPDYLRIIDVIEVLTARPVVAALTATAAPPVREEIVTRLGLQEPAQVVQGFDRPEIHLAVRLFHEADDQEAAVLATAGKESGTGIVYAATRAGTERYAGELSLRPYHAGLSRRQRDGTQETCAQGASIFATSAVGMGIDRPDAPVGRLSSGPGSRD